MRILSTAFLVGLVMVCTARATMAQQSGSLEPHIAALRSLEPAERVTAVQALGEARDPAAVQPLSEVLRSDPSAEVRGWAVRSLAQIGTTEANATVAAAAQRDADERVRSLAAQLSGQEATTPITTAPAVMSPQISDVEAAGPSRTPLQPVQRQRHRGLGLIISGWTVFGFSYMLALITGGVAYDSAHIGTWPMFIPLMGGVIELSLAYDYDSDMYYPPSLSIPAFINALLQMAGVALATAGHVIRAKSRATIEAQGGGASSRRTFALVPSGPGGPGLSFMANF